MSPPEAVTQARPGALGRPRKRDWATVISRHVRDDWPPPAWVASAAAQAGNRQLEKTVS